jgi:hypothetical protein
MQSRKMMKNVVVAVTLGLAAIATWAVTQSDVSAIEASSVVVRSA